MLEEGSYNPSTRYFAMRISSSMNGWMDLLPSPPPWEFYSRGRVDSRLILPQDPPYMKNILEEG